MCTKNFCRFCSIVAMLLFSLLCFESLALTADKAPVAKPTSPVAPNPLSQVALSQIGKVINSAQNTYTQTQAWFSNTGNVKKLDENYCKPKCQKNDKECQCKPYWNDRYENMFRECIAREQMHPETYFFYHGYTKAWMVPQDLYKLLYEKKYGPLKNQTFTFLRYAPIEKGTAKELLKKYFEEKGLINDNITETKALLISANLVPTGNTGTDGEATLSYLDKAQSHELPGDWAYEQISKAFGITPELMNHIKPLCSELATKLDHASDQEVLLQICIPKLLVDDMSYIAWRQGIPRQEQIIYTINQMAEIIKKDDAKQKNFQTPFERIKSARALLSDQMMREKDTNYFYQVMKESIEHDGFKTSTWIDQYTKAPALLMGKDNEIQARLLTNGLQDPNSGIIMYKYHFIPPAIYKDYQIKLQKIVDELWAQKTQQDLVVQALRNFNAEVKQLENGIKKQVDIA